MLDDNEVVKEKNRCTVYGAAQKKLTIQKETEVYITEKLMMK